MDLRGWLIIWMNSRTLLALTVTPSAGGALHTDVTEKIKLGDNLMNKIQRALRAKVIGDRPPGTGGRGPAGGASTSTGGSGGTGVPGSAPPGRRDAPVKRLTNPYLDTTKNDDVTSRYTFADVNIDDIEVATAPSRITDRGFTGKSNSTGGENRRAYDRESTSETEEPPPRGGAGSPRTELHGDKMEEFRRYVEQNPEQEDQYVKMRATAGRRGRGGWVTPDTQQLDLAPARGGRVAAKRLKGRVCQRNVLLPEGPKYDSQGRVYLAGFQRGAHDFQHTRRPKLILPRCCNCCRKSVLGCE